MLYKGVQNLISMYGFMWPINKTEEMLATIQCRILCPLFVA